MGAEIFSRRILQPRTVKPAREHGRADASRGSDAGLAERAALGDAAAFGDLYATHLDAVFCYVRFRVRDEETAADITQDVFLRAYRSLDTLRQAERFRAWLFRIAHNAVLNHLRRRNAYGAEAAVTEHHPAPDRTPEERAGQSLDMAAVLEAAEGLTDLQRQVIALRFLSDLTVAETAEILERTPNAIHNLQHNALAALRRQLTRLESRR